MDVLLVFRGPLLAVTQLKIERVIEKDHVGGQKMSKSRYFDCFYLNLRAGRVIPLMGQRKETSHF